LGLKVLLLDSPTTIAASREQIRQVGAALDAKAAGERLIARVDAAVAAADPCSQPPFTLSLSKGTRDNRTSTSSARTGECGERPTALLFISDNFANGGPSLLSEMLTRAGFGVDGKATASSDMPIERVMRYPPAVMLEPDPDGRTATLRRRVLTRAGVKVAEARFPRTLVNCGGPTIIPAMQRLAAIRASMAR
jgi:iron complex transport system substrate-binding protein